MKKDKTHVSLRKVLRSSARVWKLFWKLTPGFLVSSSLYGITQALAPYVTLWFSARLVGELAGARDAQALAAYAAGALASAAGMAVLNAALMHRSSAEKPLRTLAEFKLYADKMVQMDYVDQESAKVQDLFTRIRQSRNFAGRGINNTLAQVDFLPLQLVRILGGVGLTVSLFTAKVPSGPLTALNSPLFIPLVIGAFLGGAVLSSALYSEGQGYWSNYDEQGRFSNRMFSFYDFLSSEEKRASDLRMYDQVRSVATPLTRKYDGFSTKSVLARSLRGRYGVMLGLAECVSGALTGAMYLFVCLKAWGGAFGVGEVTQYVGAITSLFLGVENLLSTLADLRANEEFLDRTFEFLDLPNQMYQGSLTTEKRSDRQYEVEFRDVSFRYPGSETYALRHVNLKFRVGSRLAVVGQNGSGKTTFIKLLCRLYDPTEGTILLNGIDIRKYRYDEYMDIFSVVFQDFQLFSLPLGQNVAGCVAYDEARVTECLDKAGFSERLERLPNRLLTMLGKDLSEEGVSLSGGEAQKAAIARALYKDAPFIILDEPTAALDPIAEAEIYEKFNDIAGDRTAVYISHRLSSCKFCDEIAVFHEGAVVQKGTHEQLLADEGGKYHELWHAQAQYYTA